MAYPDLNEVLAEDGGLRFILDRLPQASGCETDSRRKFKYRESEKTASASLKRTERGHWIVTDFGGASKGMNAVNLLMDLTGCDFVTAINTVASFYGVAGSKADSSPRSEYNEWPAGPEDQEGSFKINYKEHSIEDLKTIFVDTAWKSMAKSEESRFQKAVEICTRYHLKSVDSFSVCSEGKVKDWKSTPTFPIFYFDERDGESQWGKIYQPLAEKKFRFRYLGKKPARFIHGLEAARTFCKGNDTTERRMELEKKLEAKQIAEAAYKKEKEDLEKIEDKKLPELIMCSGGSDALNVAALGYWVLWRNSETEELNPAEYKSVMKCCDVLFNLPDIDATGRVAGHKLALQYLEMKTIWLPEKMAEDKDREGKPRRKDLRDWLRFPSEADPRRHNNKFDFDQLIKTALPYRFWDEHEDVDQYGKPKMKFGRPLLKYAVNNVRMYNFLYRCGFGRYEDRSEKLKYSYVWVDKNIVRTIEPIAIKNFINEFLEQRSAVEDLRNTFYRSPQLTETSFSNLPVMTLDFLAYAADRQFLFFDKTTWMVTAEGVVEVKQEESGKHVWESKVLAIKNHRDRSVRIDEPYFRIEKKEGVWDIDILNRNVAFLNFLIQTARVHWRDELEYRLDIMNAFETDKQREAYLDEHGIDAEMRSLVGRCSTAAGQEEYLSRYKFAIDGPLLKEKERNDQKLFLINRIFCIGYILHRHKFKSRPWAVFAMDNRLSEDGVANGGAGKSIVTDSLQLVLANTMSKERHIEMIKGRSDTINTYDFVFEGVSRTTDLVLVDDVAPTMDFKVFYEPLTTDWKVNRRNRGYETIPFGESPKVWMNSNYGDRYTEGSDTRRKIVTGYSDYYHDNPHGFYREARTPFDDFGKQLFDDWNPEEWTTFYNFMAQCIQFYLSVDEKIQPPMGQLTKRNLLTDMGENFLQWADVYFDADSGAVNQLVVKDEAMEDFQRSSNFQKMTSQKFMSKLRAWAKYRERILNPEELLNKDGRIVRKPLHYDKVKEMIYVQIPGAQISEKYHNQQ